MVQINYSEGGANHTDPEASSDRVTLLDLMASQAAMSLENASLSFDLQRSEAFLAIAQSLSHTGSFGWNVVSGEIYWSAETFNIFEYDQAAKSTLEMVLRRTHPDDRDRVQQTLDRASEARANFELEHRLLMPDGSVKHLHVSARVLTTPSGNLEFVGAVTDVTPAKLAEEKSRQDEHELRRIANRDFGQVIAPALVALGGREDVTIIVTTGGQPVESIPVAIPSNARIASFLPYAQIMPEIDLLITNGGYGTVNMAISHGIPIISAGLTEDKEEVSAHVQWSGAGIDLRTNQATPEAIRHAVEEIFAQPGYRERAQQLSLAFANHDVESELLSLIEECVRDSVTA
jgi:PAS domain-containing protein